MSDATLSRVPAHPRRLYRYRPPEHALEEIAQSYVWFTHPRDFHDPLDCGLARTRDDYTDEELDALIPGYRAKLAGDPEALAMFEQGLADRPFAAAMRSAIPSTFAEHQKDTRETCGVCCLAETFDHPLMWAHYAAGHQGVCLAFDPTCHPFDQSRKVQYVDDVPIVDVVKYMGAPDQHAIAFAEQTLLAKARTWEHEREWRLVTAGDNRAGFDPAALKAILLGVNADLRWAESIAQAIRGRVVPVYSGALKQRTIGIEFRAVEPPHQLYDPNV